MSLRLVLPIAGTAVPAAPKFPLGLAYSEQIGTGSLNLVTSETVATDSPGAVYILANFYITAQQSVLTKLTATGDLVYQTTLRFSRSP